ncbi:MAG TPA: ThiF family adenylyltransferase [Candidatus Woesearchaeota archaeon]|nr:ThiF family adenylyltransferase [Candidatus Woesearchaeota archaeon]
MKENINHEINLDAESNKDAEFNKKYFSRELLYSWLSPEKIKELSKKKVLIIGVGGLGSFSSTILFKSGIFNLTVMDYDEVDISNLHRQLYSIKELGKNKAKLTSERLSSYFKGIKTSFITEKLSEKNMALIKDYDLIIDGTDNLCARYLINKSALLHNKPVIFAMIGNSKVMIYPKNIGDPCLSCFLNIKMEKEKEHCERRHNKDAYKDDFEDSKNQTGNLICMSNNDLRSDNNSMSDNSKENNYINNHKNNDDSNNKNNYYENTYSNGDYNNNNTNESNNETKAVIAPVNVLAASLQSYIAIKMLLGQSIDFEGKLITFDFEELKLRKIEVKKNKNCPICSK